VDYNSVRSHNSLGYLRSEAFAASRSRGRRVPSACRTHNPGAAESSLGETQGAHSEPTRNGADQMDFRIPILGFVVGLLVGLTGMGGGALMTPALILLGLAHPAIAVGTDLVWGTLTKAVGAFVHFQQKTVDFTIVRRLATGSIPGALAGLVLLVRLHRHGVETMDRVIVRMLAIVLMCVALSLFVRATRGRDSRIEPSGKGLIDRAPAWLTSVLGAVVGFLVSLTSVGSGSLVVASLVVLYPSLPTRRIVGSDILHSLFLVGISALGHLGIGSINVSLLAALLVGSIPGVWVGSKTSVVISERILQPLLGTTLLFLGYKLL
jgi:uncharacterized membrane protein YfcA